MKFPYEGPMDYQDLLDEIKKLLILANYKAEFRTGLIKRGRCNE